MKLSDFHFDLPERLIARQPLPERSASRLLHLEGRTGVRHHRQFRDLLELLSPDDLLVFNDTRVIPARLFGQKDSGGRVEVLVERLLGEREVLAHMRASKPARMGATLLLGGDRGAPVEAEVLGRQDDLFHLRFAGPVLPALEALGHIPLPPYMQREDAQADRERYQTVYARAPGAVAAPTAGLHFDQPLLDALREKGVRSAHVTLHVGAGTFQPIRVEDVTTHRMHAEQAEVSEATCQAIAATRARGGRVVAVGTTSVRSLESATGEDGITRPFSGDTRIFIRPGYRFGCVDALITNFHLPDSTLMLLVSALAGREAILAAYREAVAMEYRFYSYGDAMFIDARGDT